MTRWLFPSMTALAVSTALGGPAVASTPSAWEDFRRDVEAACRTAVAATIPEPQIVVDPFGLESYGLAFISGTSSQDGSPQSLVCVYDKAAGTVEVGGALALETTVPSLRPDLAPEDAVAPETVGSEAADGGVTERLLSPETLGGPEATATLSAPAEGPVDAPVAPDAPPAATAVNASFAGLCDDACTATLAGLAVSDRASLEGLAAQIERTVAANAEGSLGEETGGVRAGAEAAAQAIGGDADGVVAPSASLVGGSACTLYYFGYDGEAARTVGTHRCEVSEEAGALSVEKVSGEGLRAELRPLVGPVSAFVGRSFAAGAEGGAYDPDAPDTASSDEFGNAVGFATVADDRLLLISSQRRRFEASDSFFWVLAVDAP